MTDHDLSHRWALGDKFNEVYPHHGSISAFWNLEWKAACQRLTYPFHDGKFEDFEPIFARLIKKGIHDGYSDEFSHEYLPTAERLAQEGDAIMTRADQAWGVRSSEECISQAVALFGTAVRDIAIPHGAAVEGEGQAIPAYVSLPNGVVKSDPCPAILVMCGLDGHRPDFTLLLEELTRSREWAAILVDIPGTGDCPADRRDPAAPERMWTSVLQWMDSEGVFDMRKVVCWGLSAGGYYAVRTAHTHAKPFLAAIGQGAGTHHFFDRDWLEKGQWHEYPWTFLPALTEKFGYKSIEDFLERAQKDFSLVEPGIVDVP